MATEILVNDGGAPARILNLGNANAALSAGTFVDINSSGKIIAAADDQEASSSGEKVALGVLLVDAAAAAPTSILTGKGIVCNVLVGADTTGMAIGAELTVNELGKVEATADADAHRAVAIQLAAVDTAGEDSSGAATSFVKVLLI
tara:strand:- start:258 stop:695 length:438 start_codon:yes stop_codon:yes gene_type:complete